MTDRMARALRHAALLAFCLHLALVLWAWSTSGRVGRGILVWIDFPCSLLFLELTGGRLLAASLSAGGLQWAVWGALLTYLLGRSVPSRKPPPAGGLE